uniref:FBA_2 domain-containing protein n=1 Tax=Steinernema glaseri TaxID=37863 RepID=A0A1I7XZ95_9BILA
MDNIPIAFFDELCVTFSVADLCVAKELSGTYGKAAKFALDHMSMYESTVENGVETSSCLNFDYDHREVSTAEEIAAVPRKYVQIISIELMDGSNENVSRKLAQRFPYAMINYVHRSSSMNEAWVDFASSMQSRLGDVDFDKKLDDNAVRLFQKLVKNDTFTTLAMDIEACEGRVLEASKSLFCQKNFMGLRLNNYDAVPWDGACFGKILLFWSENSYEMSDKYLSTFYSCEGAIEELESFVLREAPADAGIQDVLKVCSKEEEDAIGKDISFAKPSRIYKYEEGEEWDKRWFYICFECEDRYQIMPPNHEELDELCLLDYTVYLKLIFA